MSDFAARLVARAQGRGSILAPRAPPRFAPQPGGFSITDRPAPWVEAEPSLSPARDADRPTPQPIEAWSDRSPDRPATVTHAVVPAPAAMPEAARFPAPTPADAPERPAIPVAAAVRSEPPPPVLSEAASELSAVTQAPVPPSPSVPRASRLALEAAPAATADEPIAAPARIVAPAPAANGRIQPLAARSAAAPPAVPRAEPPPPVVIEIGAVEFRTMQPTPPPAAPPPRPAPGLTLDAYLAQRASRPGAR